MKRIDLVIITLILCLLTFAIVINSRVGEKIVNLVSTGEPDRSILLDPKKLMEYINTAATVYEEVRSYILTLEQDYLSHSDMIHIDYKSDLAGIRNQFENFVLGKQTEIEKLRESVADSINFLRNSGAKNPEIKKVLSLLEGQDRILGRLQSDILLASSYIQKAINQGVAQKPAGLDFSITRVIFPNLKKAINRNYLKPFTI